MKRKICIVTGSRAEYGLLMPLLEQIASDAELELQLIATGMHLSPEFGLTYQDIRKDGFNINEKIEILLSSDTPIGISKSMGLAMISFAEAYERLKPDIIVVLGDRFEIFSAVASALVSRIPVAHIHGGEITKGAFDNSFRHSITKMSHLHFTSTEEYRKRVIQLGEQPDRVFNVGAIALENIKRLKLLSKEALEKELDFTFGKQNLLVTFHPATLEDNTSQVEFQNLLDVLDELNNTNIIFTKSNADTYGRIINKMIDEYVAKNPQKTTAFTSLGQLRYLSIMQFVDAVVGNSSSGIVEAPSFKLPVVNIGDRQNGRIKAVNVIDVACSRIDIKKGVEQALSKEFRKGIRNIENPYAKYEDGRISDRIKETLKNIDLDKSIIKKAFCDIEFRWN